MPALFKLTFFQIWNHSEYDTDDITNQAMAARVLEKMMYGYCSVLKYICEILNQNKDAHE